MAQARSEPIEPQRLFRWQDRDPRRLFLIELVHHA
jgi:hypothetical protein